MRDDPKRGETFRQSQAFEVSTAQAAKQLGGDHWGKNSLSGNERNRLFLSHGGQKFTDVSLLSGADHRGDGRSVAVFDYNRDGMVDLATINTNAPKLLLLRNELESPHHFAFFRFQGANRIAKSGKHSNRDGIGTQIIVKAGGQTYLEELRAGEGFSAQNSSTIHLGLGAATQIESLEVHWPSGKKETFKNLPVDQLITLTEGVNKKSRLDLRPYRIEASSSSSQ